MQEETIKKVMRVKDRPPEDPEYEIIQIKDVKETKLKSPYSSGFNSIDKITMGGFRGSDLIIISGQSGRGKCFAKNTKILMYDGSIKNVQDIVVGDKVMGSDSTPRNVLSLGRGKEMMYEIIPTKGKSFICNEGHILSLRTAKGKIANVTIKDYFNKSKYFKATHKLYKTGVDFKSRKLPIDPYFLGLWLGDGDSNSVSITNIDKEIIDYLYKYADKIGKKCVERLTKNRSPRYTIIGNKNNSSLQGKLWKLDLYKNKHIPNIYKINSKKNRLQLLAGLIDTDGYKHYNNYEIIQKNKRLADDIMYLASSLGFATYSHIKIIDGINYYRISIIGDTKEIPVKIKRKKCKARKQIKNPLHNGFTIKKLKEDNYYGFELDGNRLFLLEDFTVAHNTHLSLQMIKNFSNEGRPVLLFSFEEPLDRIKWRLKNMEAGNVLCFAPKKLKSGAVEWLEEKILDALAHHFIEIVVIDNLDFITAEEKQSTDDKWTMQSRIIGMLKRIANEYEVIIILNAHVKKIDESSPKMEDLYGSGDIYKLADFVIFIHRLREKSETRGITPPFSNISEIIVEKNRLTGQLVKFNVRYENNILLEDELLR